MIARKSKTTKGKSLCKNCMWFKINENQKNGRCYMWKTCIPNCGWFKPKDQKM